MIGGTIYTLLKLADTLQLGNKYALAPLKKLHQSCISGSAIISVMDDLH